MSKYKRIAMDIIAAHPEVRRPLLRILLTYGNLKRSRPPAYPRQDDHNDICHTRA